MNTSRVGRLARKAEVARRVPACEIIFGVEAADRVTRNGGELFLALGAFTERGLQCVLAPGFQFGEGFAGPPGFLEWTASLMNKRSWIQRISSAIYRPRMKLMLWESAAWGKKQRRAFRRGGPLLRRHSRARTASMQFCPRFAHLRRVILRGAVFANRRISTKGFTPAQILRLRSFGYPRRIASG